MPVDGAFVPTALVAWESLLTDAGFVLMVVDGILIGFGARWVGGCTSGHEITGLVNLRRPSPIAVIGFFAGGLLAMLLVLPLALAL